MHIACADFLRIACLSPYTFWWTNAAQKGSRSGYEQKVLAAMGQKAGITDIMVLNDGVLLAPELKAPPKVLKSGKLSRAKPVVSDDQIECHKRLRLAGAVVEIVRSVEGLERFLRNNGVPLSATVLPKEFGAMQR